MGATFAGNGKSLHKNHRAEVGGDGMYLNTQLNFRQKPKEEFQESCRQRHTRQAIAWLRRAVCSISMNQHPEPSIRDLYPDLSGTELTEADDNLERYLALVLRIFERTESEPNLRTVN